MLENPVFTGMLGVILGSAGTIISTYLTNKNQREIAKLDITYKHRLRIITNFLSNLMYVRHSMEYFVYSDSGLEFFPKSKKSLSRLKHWLVQMRFSEKDLYRDMQNDFKRLYDLIQRLTDMADAYSQLHWELSDGMDEKVMNTMKEFIELAESVEKKVFVAETL